jgi:hypothetical protein
MAFRSQASKLAPAGAMAFFLVAADAGMLMTTASTPAIASMIQLRIFTSPFWVERIRFATAGGHR